MPMLWPVSALSHQRCFHHAGREAVVRCPECGQFFCRECVTEHADRMICATCLRKLAAMPLTRRPSFVNTLRVVQLTLGALVVWVFFYWTGQILLQLPSA